jgi:hypothetical protein
VPEEKRQLGGPKRTCADGIRMNVWEIGCGIVDSACSGMGPVADSRERGNKPSGSGATELITYSNAFIRLPQIEQTSDLTHSNDSFNRYILLRNKKFLLSNLSVVRYYS